MMFLFLLFCSNVYAATPLHWEHILEVNERHEFYQNHETLVSPKNSWQTLFSLVYINRDLSRLKDCVFYRTPGVDEGILKLKTISAFEKCEDHLLGKGDTEMAKIKSLAFAVLEKKITLDMSFSDFKTEKWEATLQTTYTKRTPEMNLSSADYKSTSIIYLASRPVPKGIHKKPFLKNGTLCHNINDDCEEVGTQTCSDCQEGWYEVPNGCISGPKFCGPEDCGKKNGPACRRGMSWQRKEDVDFDCRTNSTFAYCSEGLKVDCEGRKAFCR